MFLRAFSGLLIPEIWWKRGTHEGKKMNYRSREDICDLWVHQGLKGVVHWALVTRRGYNLVGHKAAITHRGIRIAGSRSLAAVQEGV